MAGATTQKDADGRKATGVATRPHRLERLRRELSEQAEVFDDPGAYLAGVEDVFIELEREERDPELPPRGAWFG
ncbi:MAG: hypothetical protein R3320_03760 [Nitriliruptorales bacterium]|nr:hypothetical protein [Nitriliruptorales bacterium]